MLLHLINHPLKYTYSSDIMAIGTSFLWFTQLLNSTISPVKYGVQNTYFQISSKETTAVTS
jgi:hypothetical protein